jgi:predicted aspartyl protease
MGKVWAEIEVSNDSDEVGVREGRLAPEAVRKAEVRALVDTGATLLVLPEEVIGRLGLALRRTVQSRLADGKLHPRRVYGPVLIRAFKRTMSVEALEAPPGVPALLGQIPLECLDLLVDSRNQRLVRNPESPDPEMALVDVL